MNDDLIDNRAWACLFADGQVMFSSVSRTQKGSIKLARTYMKEDNWRALKMRGVRCFKVEVTKVDDSSNGGGNSAAESRPTEPKAE